MAEAVEAGSGELATDHLAERAVERRENRGVIREGKGQQRQGARWRDAAESGAREVEIERALLHIGEHLRIGAEAAFREDVEAERAIGVAADRLGHFGEALGGRALGGLVDAEAVMEAGFGHRAMIVAGAGWAMPLTPPMLNCAPLILPRDAGEGNPAKHGGGGARRNSKRCARHETRGRVCPLRLASLATSPAPRGRSPASSAKSSVVYPRKRGPGRPASASQCPT